MNLINDHWLHFRHLNGEVQPMTLAEALSNSQVIDFDLPRADFHGAAYQFAIGLLQTCFAPDDELEWEEKFHDPAIVDDLHTAFSKVSHAFNLTGDGPLFMQDFDVLADAKPNPVSGLFIEAPGENALKRNTDHFIKRGTIEALSPEMAALALFTLQINAPAGGQGHRTGLRGGGPLTTLVMPTDPAASLWQKIWLNILSIDRFGGGEPNLHSAEIFPWLEATRTSSAKNSEVYPNDVHPLHMYWAMPRRIRLEIEAEPGICSVSGQPTDRTVKQYRAVNYGYNYSGDWRHPLTPYSFDPKKPDEPHNPRKGQPGGYNYKQWDALTLASSETGRVAARVVQQYSRIYRYLEGRMRERPRPHLWVFGYDMDNMKARGWESVEVPLFAMPPEMETQVLVYIIQLQNLASEILSACKDAVKIALCKTKKNAKGDWDYINVNYWQRTEAAFYSAVEQIVKAGGDPAQVAPEAMKEFARSLAQTALEIYDDMVLSSAVDNLQSQERFQQRIRLAKTVNGGKAIKAHRQTYNIGKQQEVANG